MMTDLGAPIYQQDKFIFSQDHSPGSRISIVRQVGSDIVVSEAIWWLMLDPATMKPNNKYASFNSRSDKLDTPRSLAYRPYRESRCIILATAFIEGLGDGKTYHKLEIPDQAIPFGGIYKEWVHSDTGEHTLSASIITLPPPKHEGWSRLHPKSMPLILPQSLDAYQQWLNPEIQDVERFQAWLNPELPANLVATQIGKVSKWNAVGDPFLLT